MKKFVWKLMKGNKKEYVLLVLVLSIIISFLYVLLSLYDIISRINVHDKGLALINFIGLAITIFVILQINNYFVKERIQEYALLLLTGRNMKNIIAYILMHFGFVLFIAFIIGGVLGTGWIVLLNYLYNKANLAFTISFPNFLYYLLSFMVCMAFLLAINIAKFNLIEIDINNYLSNKVNRSIIVAKKNTKTYLLFNVLGIMLLSNCFSFTIGDEFSMTSVLMFIGVISGVLLLTNCLVPFIYSSFHKSLVLKSKKIMFILNGFMELSTTMRFVLIINSIMIAISLISILLLEYTALKFAAITIFILVLFMIMICFILQLNLYCKELSYKINILKSLGYKMRNIQIVQLIQVFMFILTVLLPLIVFSTSLIGGYYQGLINMGIIILLIGSYIGIYILISIYMVIKFNKTIKEVYNCVKYLNRS